MKSEGNFGSPKPQQEMDGSCRHPGPVRSSQRSREGGAAGGSAHLRACPVGGWVSSPAFPRDRATRSEWLCAHIQEVT
jgi:hypothetical protein